MPGAGTAGPERGPIDGDRVPATAGNLAGLVRSAFGAGTRLEQVTRLRGGSKKGVYRVILDGGSTAIVYSWDPREDYWSAASGDGTTAGRDDGDPFSHATGLDLFRAAHDRLTGLGVRAPGSSWPTPAVSIIRPTPPWSRM
jgi:hypothetical protein